MHSKNGYIYILTNPSFPDYVKLGYARDVKRRVAELNRSECTPYAFRVFATYEVDTELSDKQLHSIIDKLNPDLRSIEEMGGRKRVREFYAMDAEDAYEILEAMAQIHGTEARLQKWAKNEEEDEEERVAEDVRARSTGRRKPFAFSMCGIKPGEQICFTRDPSVTATVADDNHVLFQGETIALSPLATRLLRTEWQVQGPAYFSYKGKRLSELRMESEQLDTQI